MNGCSLDKSLRTPGERWRLVSVQARVLLRLHLNRLNDIMYTVADFLPSVAVNMEFCVKICLLILIKLPSSN